MATKWIAERETPAGVTTVFGGKKRDIAGIGADRNLYEAAVGVLLRDVGVRVATCRSW